MAFTRAEKRLFLSFAKVRRLHGDTMLGIPSPFLDELPEQHIQRVSRVAESGSSYGGRSTLGAAYYGGGSRYEYDQSTPQRSFPSSGRNTTQPSLAFKKSPPGSTAPARHSTGGLLGVGGNKPAARVPGESYVDRSDGDLDGTLMAGMRVRHAKYGEGDVLSVEQGRPVRVTVRFAGWGVKQIVASYLEPMG